MSVPVDYGGGGNLSEGSFGGCLPPAAPGRAAARGTRPAGRKGKEKGKELESELEQNRKKITAVCSWLQVLPQQAARWFWGCSQRR